MVIHILSKKVVLLTNTVGLGVQVKAHRTSRFRVAPERSLCIHTLEAEPTVVALLQALVDICNR